MVRGKEGKARIMPGDASVQPRKGRLLAVDYAPDHALIIKVVD